MSVYVAVTLHLPTGDDPVLEVRPTLNIGDAPWVFVSIDGTLVCGRRPGDVAAIRDGFGEAYRLLVAELIARGDWVECDRCGQAVGRVDASRVHVGPDSHGNYDLLATLCPACHPDGDPILPRPQPDVPVPAGGDGEPF